MNLYIGNLAREITQDDLLQVFGAFGQVVSATVIRDKFSGESRGFGFVEMPAKSEAEAAMNGIREIKGRMVTINEARPREPRPRGGGARGGFDRGRGGRERRGGWR
jgi:RNA recognition motif-containing protein